MANKTPEGLNRDGRSILLEFFAKNSAETARLKEERIKELRDQEKAVIAKIQKPISLEEQLNQAKKELAEELEISNQNIQKVEVKKRVSEDRLADLESQLERVRADGSLDGSQKTEQITSLEEDILGEQEVLANYNQELSRLKGQPALIEQKYNDPKKGKLAQITRAFEEQGKTPEKTAELVAARQRQIAEIRASFQKTIDNLERSSAYDNHYLLRRAVTELFTDQEAKIATPEEISQIRTAYEHLSQPLPEYMPQAAKNEKHDDLKQLPLLVDSKEKETELRAHLKSQIEEDLLKLEALINSTRGQLSTTPDSDDQKRSIKMKLGLCQTLHRELALRIGKLDKVESDLGSLSQQITSTENMTVTLAAKFSQQIEEADLSDAERKKLRFELVKSFYRRRSYLNSTLDAALLGTVFGSDLRQYIPHINYISANSRGNLENLEGVQYSSSLAIDDSELTYSDTEDLRVTEIKGRDEQQIEQNTNEKVQKEIDTIFTVFDQVRNRLAGVHLNLEVDFQKQLAEKLDRYFGSVVDEGTGRREGGEFDQKKATILNLVEEFKRTSSSNESERIGLGGKIIFELNRFRQDLISIGTAPNNRNIIEQAFIKDIERNNEAERLPAVTETALKEMIPILTRLDSSIRNVHVPQIVGLIIPEAGAITHMLDDYDVEHMNAAKQYYVGENLDRMKKELDKKITQLSADNEDAKNESILKALNEFVDFIARQKKQVAEFKSDSIERNSAKLTIDEIFDGVYIKTGYTSDGNKAYHAVREAIKIRTEHILADEYADKIEKKINDPDTRDKITYDLLCFVGRSRFLGSEEEPGICDRLIRKYNDLGVPQVAEYWQHQKEKVEKGIWSNKQFSSAANALLGISDMTEGIYSAQCINLGSLTCYEQKFEERIKKDHMIGALRAMNRHPLFNVDEHKFDRKTQTCPGMGKLQKAIAIAFDIMMHAPANPQDPGKTYPQRFNPAQPDFFSGNGGLDLINHVFEKEMSEDFENDPEDVQALYKKMVATKLAAANMAGRVATYRLGLQNTAYKGDEGMQDPETIGLFSKMLYDLAKDEGAKNEKWLPYLNFVNMENLFDTLCTTGKINSVNPPGSKPNYVSTLGAWKETITRQHQSPIIANYWTPQVRLDTYDADHYFQVEDFEDAFPGLDVIVNMSDENKPENEDQTNFPEQYFKARDSAKEILNLAAGDAIRPEIYNRPGQLTTMLGKINTAFSILLGWFGSYDENDPNQRVVTLCLYAYKFILRKFLTNVPGGNVFSGYFTGKEKREIKKIDGTSTWQIMPTQYDQSYEDAFNFISKTLGIPDSFYKRLSAEQDRWWAERRSGVDNEGEANDHKSPVLKLFGSGSRSKQAQLDRTEAFERHFNNYYKMEMMLDHIEKTSVQEGPSGLKLTYLRVIAPYLMKYKEEFKKADVFSHAGMLTPNSRIGNQANAKVIQYWNRMLETCPDRTPGWNPTWKIIYDRSDSFGNPKEVKGQIVEIKIPGKTKKEADVLLQQHRFSLYDRPIGIGA